MIYVMSDIHGNKRRFDSIMEQIALRSEDTLYILGDVIDRHPHGIEILLQLMGMPNVKMILGNHEVMMLDALTACQEHDSQGVESKKMRLWYKNGGQVTHQAFLELAPKAQESIVRYLNALPLNIELNVDGKRYLLVHASPASWYQDSDGKYNSEREFAVWNRRLFRSADDGCTIIMGHTPTWHMQDESPMSLYHDKDANIIHIDCGSGYPNYVEDSRGIFGRLCCLRLNDMKVFYSKENITDPDYVLSAPEIESSINWLKRLDYGHYNFSAVYTEDSMKYLNELFALAKEIAPMDSNPAARQLYLMADRGPFELFREREFDSEYPESPEELKAQWEELYPSPTDWFHCVLIDDPDNGYKGVLLNHSQVIEINPRHTSEGFPYDVADLAHWLVTALKSAIDLMRQGSYDALVRKELSIRQRVGTVKRSDLWAIYPDIKEEFFEDLSQKQVEQFLDAVKAQPASPEELQDKLSSMTANDFFSFCSKGYAAMGYEISGRTPSEQYRKFADGRDDGLSEIDPDSTAAFQAWITNRKSFGGHPWEVCRGGNSTHISLYVRYSDDSYTLTLAGSAVSRTVETIKFYLALKEAGLPVFLRDADIIAQRMIGDELVGIVPKCVIPAYCGSWFPEQKVISFMNLPMDAPEKLVEKCTWQEPELPKLEKGVPVAD